MQRTCTTSIDNLRMCIYKERLLNSLQCRRLKADLIMCYKTFHGLTDVGIATSCIYTHALSTFSLGNLFKLTKNSVVSQCENNFYINSIVNTWNSLPDFVVTANSSLALKLVLIILTFRHSYIFNFYRDLWVLYWTLVIPFRNSYLFYCIMFF